MPYKEITKQVFIPKFKAYHKLALDYHYYNESLYDTDDAEEMKKYMPRDTKELGILVLIDFEKETYKRITAEEFLTKF